MASGPRVKYYHNPDIHLSEGQQRAFDVVREKYQKDASYVFQRAVNIGLAVIWEHWQISGRPRNRMANTTGASIQSGEKGDLENTEVHD